MNTSGVVGVDPDLRVRPFFAHGETISIREFLVGAFNAEMGLEAPRPRPAGRRRGGNRVVTPVGMVLDGRIDNIEAPPVSSANEDSTATASINEIPTSIVDFMEFYLLNYFKAGHRTGDLRTSAGGPQPDRPDRAAPAATSRT